MKKLLTVVMVLTACALAQAEEPVLKIEKAWVFAVPPNAKDTAAFMTLVNPGSSLLKVTGGKAEVARKVAPMITTNHGGQMGMEDVPAFEIPVGGSLTLKPGGDHFMLFGLKSPLKAGDSVTLELKVEPGNRTVTVEAIVAFKEPK